MAPDDTYAPVGEAGTRKDGSKVLRRSGALSLAALMAFGGVTAAAIQIGPSLAGAPAAQAADAPGTHLNGITIQAPPNGAFGDWSMWLGSTRVPNTGGTGYCFEAGTDAGFTPGVEAAEADAVLNKAILDNQADVNTHPALSYLAHKRKDPRFNTPWSGVGAPYPNLRDSTDPQLVAVRAQAAQIEAAAEATAGPYTISPQLTMSDGAHGTVTGSHAVSATGNAVNGLPSTAILTNAVWDSNGSSTISLNTGDTLPGFTALATGPVNVLINAVGAAPHVTTYTVASGQDVLASAGTAPFSGRSVDVQATVAFQPTATSTAGRFVEGGQPLVDVLHVGTSTGVANDWVFANGGDVPATFDVDWFYSQVPLAASAQVPASAGKVASGKGTATGPGDVTVTSDTAAGESGYYYPVARFSKAAQPAELQQYFTGDWTAGFNDPNELTIQKYQPQVSTKASVIEDGKVHDVITVTGNEPGKELSVTTDLVLTSEAAVEGGTDLAPADAKLIGTVTTKVVGNGEFHTPDVDVPWEIIMTEKWDKGQPANLYFSERIQETESTKPWDGKELLPGETVPVEKPSIVTKASENGTAPVVSHDTGVLTGTVPSGTGITVTTLVKQFKFDDSTDGSAQAVCLDPSWSSATQTITSAGEILYPEHTIQNAGTYGYVEELNITIDKGDGSEPFTAQLHKGKCGEAAETVIVFPKGAPASAEKPKLIAPMANTGDVTAHQDMNTPLLFTGVGILALLAISGGVFIQRRKAAALAVTGNGSGADGLNS